MYKSKKASTYEFNFKTHWMDEDKLKKAYNSGKVSRFELVEELFDRLKKNEHFKGNDEFIEMELSHFTVDEDFGEAWKEIIVKEHYPHYFFKR